MANQEHLNILMQGYFAWNKWRARHTGIQPDLSDASLAGCWLDECNLIGANLRGANLCASTLDRAHLDDADLSGASFVDAHLNYASLVEANLCTVDARRAYLTGALQLHLFADTVFSSQFGVRVSS